MDHNMQLTIGRYLFLFYMVWAFIFFYHAITYAVGNRKHINKLVDVLAKNPEEFKQKKHISMATIGAGGIFILFCLKYPFIRHRRRNKTWAFDLFMQTNWVWWMMTIIIPFFLPDTRS